VLLNVFAAVKRLDPGAVTVEPAIVLATTGAVMLTNFEIRKAYEGLAKESGG
jgi:hypothetical protein